MTINLSTKGDLKVLFPLLKKKKIFAEHSDESKHSNKTYDIEVNKSAKTNP